MRIGTTVDDFIKMAGGLKDDVEPVKVIMGGPMMGFALFDLNIPVIIQGCPVIREEDGLAMSSRNRLLSPEIRKDAAVLYQCLIEAKSLYASGKRPGEILSLLVKRIEAVKSAKLDYIEIVDPETLQPVEETREDAVAALAVYFGNVRLIDNIRLRYGKE